MNLAGANGAVMRLLTDKLSSSADNLSSSAEFIAYWAKNQPSGNESSLLSQQ